LAAFVVAAVLLGFLASPSSAQDETESGETETTDTATTDTQAVDESGAADDELLREGAAVYSQVCSACHQAGGIGIEGSFPPLIDNPNIAGPDGGDYIREVINNGRQGEIVVNGVTYNGVMPSFSTLANDDVDAVVFYIESGFRAPTSPAVDLPTVGPVAGTELPALADMGWIAAFLVAALVALLVVGPRLTSQNSRLNTPWFDVWLKTATIFAAVALAVAFIPNWVLQTSTVSSLDRPVQDLIGVSVWGLGLLLCLGGLWYAHKDSRI
jgi:mono/diheme cytochrome c family protein